MTGKWPRVEDEVIISISESKMEHVICSHNDMLVITTEIGCEGSLDRLWQLDRCPLSQCLEEHEEE